MSLLNQVTKDKRLTTSSPFKTHSQVKSNEMSNRIYEVRFLNILLLFNNECRTNPRGPDGQRKVWGDTSGNTSIF